MRLSRQYTGVGTWVSMGYSPTEKEVYAPANTYLEHGALHPNIAGSRVVVRTGCIVFEFNWRLQISFTINHKK